MYSEMEYIDPGALRPFFAVAREGSFVRAARALKVQQPAVSKAVRVLEERLGATLLERRKTGATLTPAGRRVYELSEHEVRGIIHDLRQRPERCTRPCFSDISRQSRKNCFTFPLHAV